MKKQLYLLSYLVLMLSASACHSEMEEVANEVETTKAMVENVQMTFKAEFAEDALTRTQLDGTRVKWTDGDKIKVYPMASSGYYTPADFTTIDGGLIADFTGTISTSIASKAIGYYAFYPAADVTFYINPSIQFDIPAVQQATPDSYEEGLKSQCTIYISCVCVRHN